RSAYLAGTKELRDGNFGSPSTAASADLIGALTVPQVFDSVAIRIDGPEAWDLHLMISWVITDTGTTHLTELRNGTLNHRMVAAPVPGTTTFTLTRTVLIGLVTGTVDLVAALGDGTVTVDGDPAILGSLIGVVAPVDPDFAIVTP
ncbi:MAG: alkyl sulfatase C-terminal domain-containing protein, partial [Acidimicrobiia bacterium]